MIKTIEKDIVVTLTNSNGAWRSNEFFTESDYRALVLKYDAQYPDAVIAGAIESGTWMPHDRSTCVSRTIEFYKFIIIFKNEADEAEFILKECQ